MTDRPSPPAPLSRKRERGSRPDTAEPDRERAEAVQQALLGWFERVGRDLPWRRTRDPYAILVSEIMLQQTQVDRVIPKYHQFLEAFPTIEALAAAPLADVIRVWAGLGYNRRAVRLHALARWVVKHAGGQMPSDPAALRALEGLGPYTANAVACFAFGQDTPVVDTNIRRVLGRVFADVLGLDPPANPALYAFAERVLPKGEGYAWNQALMDLGATICTARNPNHAACPLALQCAGRTMMDSVERKVAERGPSYRVAQPFEQTTRYFRGQIVTRCRDLGPDETLSLDDFGKALRADYAPAEHRDWIAGLVEGLRRDGLVAVHEMCGELRVSLP
jgi:A/G-specific adenine glycosylase